MGKRIEYVDAIRGFTMFLVVLLHTIPQFFLNEVSSGPLLYNIVFSKFRMPLFFFVSGFVFFKAERRWNWDTVWSFLKKKVPVQIITPAIFMLSYYFLSNINIIDGLLDVNKRGYWFTYTLFEFFILFILSSVALDVLNIKEESARDVILLSISFLVFFMAFNTVNEYIGMPENIKGLIGLEHFSRYPFFVLGVLARKYYSLFENILEQRFVVSSATLAFIALNILSFCYRHPRIYAVSVVEDFIMAVTGIFVVFLIFRKLQNSLSHETKIGRTMQYIGKHTLDVYLIHFFVLFFFYKCLDSFALIVREMSEFNGRLLLSVSDFIIASLVVCCCLFISRIIRIIPFVNFWMFGAKKKA